MTKTEIENALVSGTGTHQGTPLAGLTIGQARYLRNLGLVGRSGGLTRRGSILAAAIRARREEEAFA